VIDADGSSGIPLDTQIFSPVAIGALIPGQNILGKVYVANPNDNPHNVTVQSFAGNPTGCNPNVNDVRVVVDTMEILDLDALFTPPLHVEIMGESKKGKGPKK